MSEGFLSRWSRLKKKTSDVPMDREARVESAAQSPGDSSSLTAVINDPAPAKLMPWAGVNPAYQMRPDGMGLGDVAPDHLSGQTQFTGNAALESQAAGSEANRAAVEARAETSSAELNGESLPDIGGLNMDSDFKPFMQTNVPAEARNAALKKLFADPSFNVMDGLDTYVADYSLPDPIPAEMLKEMLKAKAFCLFDDVLEGEDQMLAEGVGEANSAGELKSAGELNIKQVEGEAGSAASTDLAVDDLPINQELIAQELTVEEHLRLIPGPRVAQPLEFENEKQKGELGGNRAGDG